MYLTISFLRIDTLSCRLFFCTRYFTLYNYNKTLPNYRHIRLHTDHWLLDWYK